VLGAWYLFTMVRRTFFGPLREPVVHAPGPAAPIRDLNFREVALLAPIAVLCVVLGVYPQPFIKTAEGDLEIIADIAERARIRAVGSESAPAPELRAEEGNRHER